MFLGKCFLKLFIKFTAEHACRSAISIKLQSNFLEIALERGCSPVNLQGIFRTPFPKTITGRLLLNIGLKRVSIAKAVVQNCSIKTVFLKFRKIYMKTPGPESLC